MTSPPPDAFDPTPLDVAARHMARLVYLGAQADANPAMTAAESNEIRREQLAVMELARTAAGVSQAESLARIADALDRAVPKHPGG